MEYLLLWLEMAGLVVVFELLSGTLYLLMLAFSMLAGGLVALLGFDWETQVIIATLISVIFVFLLQRSKFGQLIKLDVTKDPRINLDIGQRLYIETWLKDNRARAIYRGTEWDVELLPGKVAHTGWFEIREVRGNLLLVA
ncbi:NfeD family protein [Candidatus Pandoraea novymonadis]|uniref:NfeD-like C-terminal domain-containing protein n=1 Tax=Candidatus Pandoraea novymonadis TaxID=1808959 RepID=A0ABX5FE73_9BURK|nr:NfeD family protein [Candidatus Pandoraea novymonadis]PSB92018.1 hypothetical protein BZL35_00244 [Candidatus Pandoraea novymonadis]